MGQWKNLSEIRREYGQLSLSEDDALENPIAQFESWFAEIVDVEKSDPTAMVLSTVDDRGYPDSRIVLLKELKDEHFIFYTNYQSAKAQQIQHTPYAALNFYWPEMARQVRVRGRVKQITKSQSDDYFSQRPIASQFSAMVSPQSQVIESREALEQRVNELIASHQQKPIVRPHFWGGYQVIPDEIEFWQGRINRLHDRIHYYRQQGQWFHRRLAP